MTEEFKTIETDVLIIGSGGAGLRAAIEASRNNAKVVIIDKGRVGKSGTTPTAGSRARTAARLSDKPEDVQANFKRVLQTGCYLADQDLLWKMVSESPALVREMANWAKTDMESYCDALQNELTKHSNVTELDYVMVTKLLKSNGKMVGAVGFDIVNGEVILLKAKAVVLATGGVGELYIPSEAVCLDVRTRVTGDGIVLAYNAGTELCEMEMVNFQQIPGSPKWMKQVRFVMGFLPGGGIRDLCCRGPFYDENGKEIVSRETIVNLPVGCAPPRAMDYNPNEQRLLAQEMKKHGTLYMNAVEEAEAEKIDVKALKFSPWDHALGFPETFEKYKAELSKIKLTVGALIGQGGPKVNVKGETNIPGLYGAGEGCGSGNLYGAARVVGFMYTILPSGKTAGLNAAEYITTAKQGTVNMKEVAEEKDRIQGFLKAKRNGASPQEIKAKIYAITAKYLYILRNGDGIKQAIKEIGEIRSKDVPRLQTVDVKRMNWDWVDAIEIPIMLDAAEMVAKASLFRTETRGTLNREDYPQMDNEHWLCHTLLKKGADGSMKFSKGSISMTKFKPPTLAECLKGGEPIAI